MQNLYWQNTHNKEVKSIHMLKGHQGSVESVRFDPFNQQRVYTGSYDHTIKVWDIDSQKCIKTLNPHTLGVWCVDASSKDKLIASTSPDNSIIITDTTTDHAVMNFKGHFSKGYWVEFSPNGNKLITSGMDGCIQLFDVKKGNLFKEHRMDNKIVYKSRFVNDNKIMCCTSKGEILLFDENLNLLFEKKLSDTEIRTFNTCGNKMYTSFYDNKLRQFKFEAETSLLEYETDLVAHLDTINVIETCSERNLLLTGCKDSALHAWDMRNNSFKHNLVGHTDQIADIRVQKSGKLLVSASWDQTLRLYDLNKIQED